MASAWKRMFSLGLVICLLLGVAPMHALALTPDDFTGSRDDAVVQLRNGLSAYESEICLYHKTIDPLTDEYVTGLFADALAKQTFVNSETAYSGDYLLLSVSGVEIDVQYDLHDIHYYNRILYRVTYRNSAEQEMQLREKIKTLADTIRNETRNDYQRVKRVYDYLRSNEKDASADSAVALFYAMAVSMGVDCRIITGTVDGAAHTWNQVKVYDKWYAVDVLYGMLMGSSGFLTDYSPDEFYTSAAFLKQYALSDTAFDPANVAGGSMENGLSWRYDAAEAALVISGNGPMQDFALQNYSGVQTVVRPWTVYVAEGADYIVEEGVTSVGKFAFCGVLFNEIRLPSTVQTIGEGAFRASRGDSIGLPAGISEIPTEAFMDSHVIWVDIPDSVTKIGDRAFSGCMRLDKLSVPAGIEALGEAVFEGCRSLRKVMFLGDEAAWKKVSVGGSNQKLKDMLRDGNGGFFDVPESEWFYAPVNWAAERNITGGIGSGLFGSFEGCTRAQVVTFLWAAKGRPEPKSADNPFTDVAGDAWYTKPVLWAVENGITTGVSDTAFGPDRTCTRAQIVTFLYAAAGKPEVSGNNPFGDVADSDWFLNPVLWAAEEGVTGGIAEGAFGPNDVCTRAQVVTFLYKVFGLV